jgi:hypothetical protein
MKTTAIPANDIPSAESRHEHGRDVREIARLVRADIAAAIACGTLPAGFETSVRISRFSMGQSLTVTVTRVPASFVVLSVARVRHELEHPYAPLPEHAAFRHSEEARRVVAVLERIVAAYNRDRSDTQSDSFNVTFYGHVDFATAVEQASRAEIEAAIRGSRVA